MRANFLSNLLNDITAQEMLDELSVRERQEDADAGPVARPVGVIIVEDGRVLRKATERGLVDRGFAVWGAGSGQEGVSVYRTYEDQIDVVLMDVHMPVLDGPQTLYLLRKINPSIRCCFMTGDLRESTLKSLLDHRPLQVFGKPLPHINLMAQELWLCATRPESAFQSSMYSDK
jgi:CheY-like chemotaxis protein